MKLSYYRAKNMNAYLTPNFIISRFTKCLIEYIQFDNLFAYDA